MSKILVMSTASLSNLGSMGRTIGLVECLQQTMPDACITFWLRHYKQDKDIFYKYITKEDTRIELRQHPWYRESDSAPLTAISTIVRGGLSLSFCALNRVVHKKGIYQQYDVIIEPNLVNPNDANMSAALGSSFNLLGVWQGAISGRPVVICAAGFEPLKSRVLKRFTKRILNRAALITLREEESKEHLQALGVVKPPIVVTADLAFLLQPALAERLNVILKEENIISIGSPVVGIAPIAETGFDKPEEYIQFMAELTALVVEELNATVILVPHTSYDVPAIGKVCQQVKNRHRVRAIQNLYMADEVKGVIGMCDMFISLKFHALVAALSSAIPSIGVVSYSQDKFYGIAGRLMAQEKYLVDMSKFDYNSLLAELKSKINLLWANRDSVAEELKEKAEIAKGNALLNGKLIKELVDSSKTSG